jgi:hypothetical protein
MAREAYRRTRTPLCCFLILRIALLGLIAVVLAHPTSSLLGRLGRKLARRRQQWCALAEMAMRGHFWVPSPALHTAVHETSMGRQPESRRARAQQVRPGARVRQDGPMDHGVQAGGLNVGVTSPSRQNDRATPAIARWLRCRRLPQQCRA